MKKLGTLALTLTLLTAGSAHAVEGVERTTEQAAGKPGGGMSGLMISVIGSSIGILVGAGIGALLGDEKVLRASSNELAAGEAVESRGNRTYREATALAGVGGSYR